MNRYWHLGYLLLIFTLGALVYGLVRMPSGPPGDPAARASDQVREEILRVQTAMILHTGEYDDLTWLGKPIWQPPLDLWILQEAIFEVRPELIIECGTYKGGSSYFFAQLFDLMDHGRVVTIDIERLHDLEHPRITYLIGDSTSPEIVARVREEAAKVTGPILVILDSDHSKAHVLREMEAYHDLVTPGSYLHVQDGILDVLPLFAHKRPGPLAAIHEFLETHDEFEVDRERGEKLIISHHPAGWLRRVAAPVDPAAAP